MSTYRVYVNDSSWEVTLLSREADSIRFAIGDKVYTVQPQYLPTPSHHATVRVPSATTSRPASLPSTPSTTETTSASTAPHNSSGVVRAPISGTVVALQVSVGATVTPTQPLLALEAMKMENPILSPIAGRVTSISVNVGSDVKAGQVLLVIE